MSDTAEAARPTLQELNTFTTDQGLRRLSGWASTAKLTFVMGGWVGLYLIGRSVNTTATWWAVWILMTFLFEAMGAAVHEAAHDKLYNSRRANRVAGWVTSAPRLYNFATYQIAHLEHHRYTHDPERDPEPLFEKTGLLDYLLYLIASATVYSMILFGQGLQASFGTGPQWYAKPHHQHRARVGTLIVLALLGIVVWGFVAYPSVTIRLWLVPYLLCNIISSVVTKPEHYDCDFSPAAIYDTTRTIYSNRLFGFLLWNNNLHTAHHLMPGIPGHGLPQLQRRIDPYCEHTSPSYLRWHLGLLRQLARGGKTESILRPRYWIDYTKRLNRR